MKKLIALASGLLLSAASLATTFNPVQLLNPVGSTAGQVVLSAGPSSTVNWGTLAVANVTGAAPLASPTFTGTVTIPSGASISGYLTTATAASTYAPIASPTFTGTVTIPSGASISGYAPLASPTFTGTPSMPTGTTAVTQTAGNSSTAIATTAFVTSSPIINTPTISGTTTGACAATGNIGECKNANVPSGSPVSLTTSTYANVTSVSLTAGNWLCSGNVEFQPNTTTVQTNQQAAISTTSASTTGEISGTGTVLNLPSVTGAAGTNVIPTGFGMVNVTTTTLVYLLAYSVFTTSTNSASGYINCIRWH
jgi:hypothetical protein